MDYASRKKNLFFNGQSTKAFSTPPQLSGQRMAQIKKSYFFLSDNPLPPPPS